MRKLATCFVLFWSMNPSNPSLMQSTFLSDKPLNLRLGVTLYHLNAINVQPPADQLGLVKVCVYSRLSLPYFPEDRSACCHCGLTESSNDAVVLGRAGRPCR